MLKTILNKEALIQAGATINTEYRGTGGSRTQHKVLTIGDRKIEISATDGVPYLFEGNLLGETPADVRNFVTEVSYYDNFGYGLVPKRRVGFYRLASATAILEATGRGTDGHYPVKVQAKNLSDARELMQLIHQGQIWPAIDYEAEQVPPPCRHLRDLVSEMWRLVRRDVRDRLHQIKQRDQNNWRVPE